MNHDINTIPYQDKPREKLKEVGKPSLTILI